MTKILNEIMKPGTGVLALADRRALGDELAKHVDAQKAAAVSAASKPKAASEPRRRTKRLLIRNTSKAASKPKTDSQLKAAARAAVKRKGQRSKK